MEVATRRILIFLPFKGRIKVGMGLDKVAGSF
jgi:hypothetical protein